VEHENTKLSYDSFYELAKESKKKLGMSEFTYTKTDEESKLNINTSAVEMIARLPGLNLNLAQNINASSLRPFKAKEELLLVEGITEEIYMGIKDFITVYTDGKININTASGEVLKALGLDDGLVNLIKDYRMGADYQQNSADDRVFENTGEIIDKLRVYGSLSGAQEAALVSLISQGIFVVSSKNLDLKIETKIRGKTGMKYGIILDKDRIKEWREY
jgi:DNA uptake protein ComE-like DNA-binding protein